MHDQNTVRSATSLVSTNSANQICLYASFTDYNFRTFECLVLRLDISMLKIFKQLISFRSQK